jgi:hypothetical protein
MRSRCCLCIPLLLLGNGSVKSPYVTRERLGKNPSIVAKQRLSSVKFPLSLLGNGSVKIPLLLLGNGSVETLPR